MNTTDIRVLHFDWTFFNENDYNQMVEALKEKPGNIMEDLTPAAYGFICIGNVCYDVKVWSDKEVEPNHMRLQGDAYFPHPADSFRKEPYANWNFGFAYDDDYCLTLPDPLAALEKKCVEGMSYDEFKKEFAMKVHSFFSQQEHTIYHMGEEMKREEDIAFLKAMQENGKFFQKLAVRRDFYQWNNFSLPYCWKHFTEADYVSLQEDLESSPAGKESHKVSYGTIYVNNEISIEITQDGTPAHPDALKASISRPKKFRTYFDSEAFADRLLSGFQEKIKQGMTYEDFKKELGYRYYNLAEEFFTWDGGNKHEK